MSFHWTLALLQLLPIVIVAALIYFFVVLLSNAKAQTQTLKNIEALLRDKQ
ncbi:hypothetical protein [Paenibacillus swuensis]|uniref:hypothetical protein n=1 Tax=Paenibacillus swuensis TaxID=1178515 RepID=UPI000ACBFF44|nr:hypothetical protein [Paenibacillus swuensis]